MTEYELTDGSWAVEITVPIPPFGSLLILGEDVTADSAAVLQELLANWTQLWPPMLNLMKDAMENLDMDVDLAELEIIGGASRTHEGKFMSDKADMFLSLSFGESPDWDYFIRGGKIVHFQPTF